MVKITDIFRHVTQVGLSIAQLRPFPDNSISQRIARSIFPPPQSQQFNGSGSRFPHTTAEPNAAGTSYRSSRSTGNRGIHGQHYGGFKAQQRRVDASGRIVRTAGTCTAPSLRRPTSSGRDRRARMANAQKSESRKSTETANLDSTSGLVDDAHKPNKSDEHHLSHAIDTRFGSSSARAVDLLEDIVQSVALASRARQLVEEERTTLKNLELNYASFLKDAQDLQNQRDHLESRGANERDFRSLRRQERFLRGSLEHHENGISSSREQLSRATRRLQRLESEAQTAVDRHLQGTQSTRPGPGIKALRKQLFCDPDSIEVSKQPSLDRPSKQILRSASHLASADERDRIFSSLSNSQRASSNGSASAKENSAEGEIAQELRRVYDNVRSAKHAHQDFREGYSLMLHFFLGGNNPGLDGWTVAWSREDFDVAFLRHWEALSKRITDAEKIMEDWHSVYVAADMEPLRWQEEALYQPGEYVFTSSQEADLVAQAPCDRIVAWREDIERSQLCTQDEATANTTMEDYADDVLPDAPEVQSWDSLSCRGDKHSRKVANDAGDISSGFGA